MTAARLSSALHVLRWTPTVLAREIHVNDRTVRRWLAGQNPPPLRILDWLEDLALHHQANPAPRKLPEDEDSC